MSYGYLAAVHTWLVSLARFVSMPAESSGASPEAFRVEGLGFRFLEWCS